ncbi:3-hydroxy-5-methyl-1-naphthoate 3-O-methyltransferase [Methanosarcinales archaeon]|nr:methyltransferase [Candidatus Methanoperedens sp.]CAG0984560.1 3-hydroxy-5-methyl-1-naphthoate 3-O-methyltransferase [Methanosarcinales archaeon]
MWNTNEELDIEKAGDDANKLVLLGSALKAGIFQALDTQKSLATIKKELKADERALFIVLEALCSMGYVDKSHNRYIIADKARPLFLLRGEEYVGGYLPHFMNILKSWLLLPDIIRGERPEREPVPRDIPVFMHAMASRPDRIAEEAVSQTLMRKKDAKNVLDLGGGPGKYSRAFVERGLKAVLFDMEEVIDYVSTAFNLSQIEDLTLVKGDFTKDIENVLENVLNEKFDIVFMGNICHIYSENNNRKLIRQVHDLLNKNGMIAIEDFVRGRSPHAEIFAVNMLANSEEGNTWSEAQYREWLKDGGFQGIEVIDLAKKGKQLILGFKA